MKAVPGFEDSEIRSQCLSSEWYSRLPRMRVEGAPLPIDAIGKCCTVEISVAAAMTPRSQDAAHHAA